MIRLRTERGMYARGNVESVESDVEMGTEKRWWDNG
jgi:hypothetical protein